MKKANYGKRILSFVTVLAMILSFTAMIPAASAADLERAYLFNVDFEDDTMTNKASSGYSFAHYYNDLHAVTSVATEASSGKKALKVEIAGDQIGVAKFGQDVIDPLVSLVNNTTWYEMSFKFEGSIPGIRLYSKNHAAYDVGIFRIDTEGKLYINGSSHSIEVQDAKFETGKWYDLKIAVDNYNRHGECPRVYIWINGEQYTVSGSEADGAYIWGAWAGNADMVSEMNRMMLQVNSNSSQGILWIDDFKVYNTPCDMKTGLNIGKYYDINFENKSWENAVGTSTVNPTTDGHFTPAVVFEDDAVKGSKVAKITGSGAAGNFGCIRDKRVSHSSIKENKVSWYEMSFKFDSKISAIRMEAGEYPFMVQENGKLLIGGLDAGTYVGAEIADVTLKVGEWYNLKVAVDNIDKWSGTDTKYYAWLNGELLTTGETPITGCTVSKKYLPAAGAFGYWLFIPSDGSDIGVSFDDIKAYTTDSAVKVNGAFTVNPSEIFNGTQISVNGFNFENDKITVFEDTTVAELSAAITADESANVSFIKDGAIVSDTSVLASEVCVYVSSSKSVGVKKYEIAVGKSKIEYYDINFENSAWENAAGTSTIAPNTDGHFTPAVTFVDDVVKGSKVANITGTGTAGQFGCIRDKSVQMSSLVDNRVVWYEMSFKFNGKFANIRMEAGEYPFMIQENGKLLIGGLNAGTYVGAEIADVTLKVGEWYNLKVAVDNIDKWSDTDTKYYAWLNGELLTTGETPVTGCTVSKKYSPAAGAFGYWLFIPSDGSKLDVSFDDIKSYETTKAVKTNGVFNVDPTVIFDGTQISVDGFKFEHDKITVSENTTVAELSASITADESANVIFVKDGEIVSDTSVLASETVIYVNSSKNIGVKKYNVALPEFKVEYFDIDFEDGTYANKVADGKSFGVTHNDIGTIHSIQTDSIRSSKAYKIPTLDVGGAVRFGNTNVGLTASELDNNTVWTELSFMFEDAVSNIQYEGTNYLFSVINGELYLGGIGGNTATPSRKVENFEIKPNEWYHLVIAIDNTDIRKGKKENGDIVESPVFFAWINGEMLNIEGADKDGASIWAYYNAAASTGSPTNIDTLALTIYNKGVGTTWIDNFKLYTTRGGLENAQYDSLSVVPGAKITSESLRIENAPNGVIYAPEMTIAELSEKLSENANGVLWYDGANAVTDVNVSAIGKTLYSKSSGIGVKTYIVKKGSAVDMLPETAVYDEASKTASIKLTNNTGAVAAKSVVFAVYSGDELIDSNVVKADVSVNGDTVTSRVLNVEDDMNVTVKAFIWDMSTLKPEALAVNF